MLSGAGVTGAGATGGGVTGAGVTQAGAEPEHPSFSKHPISNKLRLRASKLRTNNTSKLRQRVFVPKF